MNLIKDIPEKIEKYKSNIIIVEGKNDVSALKELGFIHVYPIHVTGIPLRVRAEQISLNVSKKDRVCILTDLDKKGKQLYLLLKPIFQELGAHLDPNLRSILLNSHVSHIESLPKFLEKFN
jgi:5S rRNA maturation endonuclease (ribonuclease M5)